MSQTREPGLTASLTAGRLEGLSVPDLMWTLCSTQRTGVLHLSHRGTVKKVFIQAGRIVFAASSDPNDRLGELLLREGYITLDHLEWAIARLHTGKRLGTLLVEGGFLTPENLVKGVLAQARGIVLGLFGWEEGEYRFDEGPLPSEEVITLDVKTGDILLQGIRQVRSFSRIRRSVGLPRTRYALADDWRKALGGVLLDEGPGLLVARLERGPESVEALCREVFLSNFEIYRTLWAFRVLGVVQELDPRVEAPAEGALDGALVMPDGAAGVLARLCRSGETGVLHVTRGGVERSFHLREGTCVFATSNDHDDGLMAHLLRRGVISLRDREEVAKRLLSNKRVGTILLEMGVLDERDLREVVREQLTEIVYDTLRWEEGDWLFLPGELPTIEEITLTATLEDLLSGGLRRVTAWSRVRGGSEAPDGRWALTPDYLSVLDRMKIGSDEWEVISSLAVPRSVQEVCRSSRLGDYRVCQILWTLRLLGAVEPVAAGTAYAEDEEETARAVAARPAAPDPEPVPIAPSTWDEAAAAEAEPGTGWDEAEGPGWALPVAEEPAHAELISDLWKLAAEQPPEREEGETTATHAFTDEVPEPVAEVPAAAETAADEVDHAAAEVPVEEPVLEVAAADSEPEPQLEPQREPQPEPEAVQEPAAAVEEPVSDEEVQAELESPVVAPADVEEPEVEEEVATLPVEAEPEEFDAPPVPWEVTSESVPEEAVGPGPAPAPEPEAPAETAPHAFEMGEPGVEHAPDVPEDRPEPQLEMAEPGFNAGATMELSREQVDALLAEESARLSAGREFTAELDTASVEALARLEQEIARFNARQKLVYRSVRFEIGAGAINFVRSCRTGLREEAIQVFGQADLKPDGTWDPDALKRMLVEKGMYEPAETFDRLLDAQIDRLQMQIGESRARALRDQLRSL